jgi:LacI family transcriptional regulator
VGHPTIKDVAKKAGVSITTVSFVLNNRPDVAISEEVRRRVAEAARDLDYHPSAMAAGLAGRRTRNVGLVFGPGDASISNPFYSFVAEGFFREVIDHGFNVLVTRMEGAYEGIASLPKFVREKNVDGVVLVAHAEPDMVEDLRRRKLPLVLVDNYPAIEGADCVHIDNRQGGYLAAQHFLRLGHRHIHLLTVRTQGKRPSILEREEGFKRCLEEAGVRLTRENVLECDDLSFFQARDRAGAFLKGLRKPAALFAVNDEMASGVLRATAEAGRKVPDELSVMGFDNIIMSNYTVPPLSTISVAKEHMGRMAASRLLQLIETKEKSFRRELAPVELIVRASTGKPAGH